MLRSGLAVGKMLVFRCVAISTLARTYLQTPSLPGLAVFTRVCAGRHFAESTLFILCASVLSAFDIGPPVGADGTPIEVKWEATDHLVVS